MSIRNEIDTWLKKSTADLIAEYNSSGRRASGNWERELETQVTETSLKINVKILGAPYTTFMENGRGPTQQAGSGEPLRDKIRQWIRDKGIMATNISEDSLVFLITRKIHRDGYKGRPLVSKAITDASINDLLSKIVGAYNVEVRSNIVKELNKVKKV